MRKVRRCGEYRENGLHRYSSKAPLGAVFQGLYLIEPNDDRDEAYRGEEVSLGFVAAVGDGAIELDIRGASKVRYGSITRVAAYEYAGARRQA